MNGHLFTFGPFRLDVHNRVLRRDNELVPLTAREFDILCALLGRAGNPVSKFVLINEIWPDNLRISENNISQQVRALRKKLGKQQDGQDYIRTIPNLGYFMQAEVAPPAELSRPTESSEENRQEPPVQGTDVSSLTYPSLTPISRDSETRKRFHVPFQAGARKALASVALAIVFGVWAWRVHSDRMVVRDLPFSPGRLFVKSASDGKKPRELLLEHIPEQLVVARDGSKVYAIERNGRRVTVIDARAVRVMRVLLLPSNASFARLSYDGKRLYVSSMAEGIMSIDTVKDTVRSEVLHTGGRVWDIANTPDGEKLFFTMGSAGLKRISMDSGELRQISDRVCPIFLELDPSGQQLLVSYQCGGPGGRSGHDTLELYDTKSEKLLATLSGPPMVGGDPIVGRRSGLVWLDGWDACSNPVYDHTGCPFVPSRVFHLFRLGDHKVIHSLALPEETGLGTFTPDGTRVAFGGPSVTVLDAAKYTVTERFEGSGEKFSQVVFTPKGDRAFVAYLEKNRLLVFEVEEQKCSGPSLGLSNFYPGDGTLQDTRDIGLLRAHGNVRFEPGFVGQAFRLSGDGSYLEVRASDACYFCNQSWTVAFYVKFASVTGEMTVLERRPEQEDSIDYRCFRSQDNRLRVELGQRDERILLSSATPLTRGAWYHVAIVGEGPKFSLFVNGKSEASGQLLRTKINDGWSGSMFLGNSPSHKAPLDGWFDEVGFWARALDSREISELYGIRAAGPCRP